MYLVCSRHMAFYGSDISTEFGDHVLIHSSVIMYTVLEFLSYMWSWPSNLLTSQRWYKLSISWAKCSPNMNFVNDSELRTCWPHVLGLWLSQCCYMVWTGHSKARVLPAQAQFNSQIWPIICVSLSMNNKKYIMLQCNIKTVNLLHNKYYTN